METIIVTLQNGKKLEYKNVSKVVLLTFFCFKSITKILQKCINIAKNFN